MADRAKQAQKELDNRNKIMAAYALKLNSLPDESMLIYTDGGWTQPGDGQDEECGWGYTVRIRYRAYPQEQVTAGTYQPEQISRDWGNGWQVELHTRWGPVSTVTKDTTTYVGALHLSNNTAELTAAVQVMLYFAALYERRDCDASVPRPLPSLDYIGLYVHYQRCHQTTNAMWTYLTERGHHHRSPGDVSMGQQQRRNH